MTMNINPTIKADTFTVCCTDHSHIRLMNDSRWPWLIALPKNSASTELHQLDDVQREGYLNDINRLSQLMQHHTQCQSVNIAMLGNVVSALHCHVVARNPGDANWPKPIWGYETAVAYIDNLPGSLIDVICKNFTARDSSQSD